MGNSGGLGALDRNVWTLRAGGLVGGQQRLVGGGLEFGDGIPAEGDADCGPVGVSVVVDLELVGAEQPAQGWLWQFREAAGRDREGVEELEGVGLVLLGGERGEVLEFGLALLIEGLEVLAKFVDDQGGLVVVAVEAVVERKGTDQAALADVQIVDGALQACCRRWRCCRAVWSRCRRCSPRRSRRSGWKTRSVKKSRMPSRR